MTGQTGCFLPKSRDIQVKMPSPKVIRNAYCIVTVRVLNSYDATLTSNWSGARINRKYSITE